MACVYWITNDRRGHYIGATTDFARRLRQHNGELAGGARRTRGRGPWSPVCQLRGFRTFQEALQFEWAFKHACRRRGPLHAARVDALRILLRRPRWTSNAPPAEEVPLSVHWHAAPRDCSPEWAMAAEAELS